jgi:geranylgeranylglycerol-phosphate geranylgeranyltransferase
MSKLLSILRLTRAEHSVMLVIAVITAELLSGFHLSAWAFALSIISPIFLSMGAFAVNDYFDIEVDRANGRKRPLVSGELKPSDAVLVTVVSMMTGMIAGALINYYCAAIAVFFGALSVLYSYRLKELPAVGNAYVALAMAIPFVFGNYVSSIALSPANAVIFAMVFLSGFAREIDATIRDFAGDRLRGASTLPKVIGPAASAYVAFALYSASVALSVYMFLSTMPFMLNAAYAVPIAVSDALLLYSGAAYVSRAESRYAKVRNISLAGMALALACFLISAILYIRIPF